MQRPFTLDMLQLLRFVALTFLTAPPNFHWQQFLERTFPMYPTQSSNAALPDQRAKDDIEMKAGAGDGVIEGDPIAPQQQDGPAQFSWRNTLTKWFVDCITMGAIMNTLAFLIIMGIMKGQDMGTIGYNIKTVSIPQYYALLLYREACAHNVAYRRRFRSL